MEEIKTKDSLKGGTMKFKAYDYDEIEQDLAAGAMALFVVAGMMILVIIFG